MDHISFRVQAPTLRISQPFGAQSGRDGDLIVGAAAIAEFMLGDREQRRRIYYWAEKGYLPVLRIGTALAARRAALEQWLSVKPLNVAHVECGDIR